MPFVLRLPGVCCADTLAVREREIEGWVFLQAGRKEGKSPTQRTETNKNTLKKKIHNFCC